LKVSGSSIAMVAIGPTPGSTPIKAEGHRSARGPMAGAMPSMRPVSACAAAMGVLWRQTSSTTEKIHPRAMPGD